MKITVAQNTGFCFGVSRAIKLAEKLIQTREKNIYSLGEIIHNPQVVEKLEKAGLRTIDEATEVTEGHILIRSHGISLPLLEKIKEKGLKIIDATCPFVKRIQRIVKKLAGENYTVVIIGDQNHPEVKGLVSFAQQKARVIKTKFQAQKLKPLRKLGIVAQTTISKELFYQITQVLLPRASEVRVYNTTCQATQKRQKAAVALARKVDLMLVVGGRNSANTSLLYQLCRQINKNTHQIEHAGEIKRTWWEKNPLSSLGITGGASTPDWVIKEVVRECKKMSGSKIVGPG